jgi:3D (Asp-Asp-Asp) domain-containing protein
MRIISMIAVLLAFGVTFAHNAKADETINTNTKTELAAITKNTVPYIFKGYNEKKEKTSEELKYEAIMSKWKMKQEHLWENLPNKTFVINASAYTAAADECGKSDGITASGIKVEEKRTLACPPQYPFGAKIKIEGVGTLTCEDRGGAIKGNHFDIYVETKKEAFAFGRKNLTAEVVLE